MRYACPACGDKTISFFRKWLSYPAIPAKCKSCSAYSYAHRDSGGVGLVVSALSMTLLGFLAAYLKSSWPLLLGGICVAAYYFWHWNNVKLESIPLASVQAARQGETVWGVTWLLLIFFN